VCVRAFGCLFVHEKETHRDVSKFLVCSWQIECDQSVHLPAKCTVLVIQYHCGQTFGTHLGGWERRSSVRSRCGRGAAPRIFFDFFLVEDRRHRTTSSTHPRAMARIPKYTQPSSVKFDEPADSVSSNSLEQIATVTAYPICSGIFLMLSSIL